MLLSTCLLLWALPGAAPAALSIEVDGFADDSGLARILLFDSPASYQGNAPPFRIESVPIRDGSATLTIDTLPEGRYAAIAHHDLNSNNALDRPYFSLPLEPYGFSGKQFTTFGVPKFESTSFIVGAGDNREKVRVRYNPFADVLLQLKPYRNLVALSAILLFPVVVIYPLLRLFGSRVTSVRAMARAGISLFLLATGSAHFLAAERMMLMLPGWLPARTEIIFATGVLEVVLALALWIPQWRRRSGIAIALMLIAFLPANIYAALNSVPFGGNQMGPAYLYVRLPYQAALILWIAWASAIFGKNAR